MPYSKANMKAVSKYMKNNYDSLLVRIPKGRKEALEEYAKANGESVNGLINKLIRETLGIAEKDWKKAEEK